MTLLKKLFGLKSRAAADQASRQALKALGAEIVQAHHKVNLAELRIARLKAVDGDEAITERDLQAAIAEDEGAGLELYTSGHATPMAALITAADAAAKAAVAARAALPAAERALADANGTVAQLQGKKRELARAVLIEHGDVLAVQYRETLIKLGGLHDELLAFAQGIAAAGYGDLTIIVADALEIPTFKLPGMQPKQMSPKPFSRHGLASDNSGYTPYLRYQVDTQKVEETAAAWTQFANELAIDPAADVTNLPAAAAEPVAPGDRKRGGLIIHRRRDRQEPSLIEVGILPGPQPMGGIMLLDARR